MMEYSKKNKIPNMIFYKQIYITYMLFLKQDSTYKTNGKNNFCKQNILAIINVFYKNYIKKYKESKAPIY